MSRYKLLPCSSNSKVRLGILGGSFDPAHEGHRHITLEAIKRLKLHKVIWLISPQNPLKSRPASTLEKRRDAALCFKHSNKIVISDIERYLPTNFTACSISRIKLMHRAASIVWLMGADNLLQINKWYQWKRIFKETYVAVFERSNIIARAMKSSAAYNFRSHKVLMYANDIASRQGRWCIFRIRQSPFSSTAIRKRESHG